MRRLGTCTRCGTTCEPSAPHGLPYGLDGSGTVCERLTAGVIYHHVTSWTVRA